MVLVQYEHITLDFFTSNHMHHNLPVAIWAASVPKHNIETL